MAISPLAFGSPNFEGLNPNHNPTKIELYESPLLGFSTTSGASIIWTHNLGFILQEVSTVLVNITADSGYSPGEEINPEGINWGGTTTTQYGFNTWVNTTEVGVQLGGIANAVFIYTKSTGASPFLTATNWKWKIRGKRITVGDVPDILTVGIVPIQHKTETNVPSISVVLDLNKYRSFIWDIESFKVATVGADLFLRTGSDGVTIDSGLSDYGWSNVSGVNLSAANSFDNADSEILIMNANNSTVIGTAKIEIPGPGDIEHTRIIGFAGNPATGTGNQFIMTFTGSRLAVEQVNILQIIASSGNLSIATHTLYGLRKVP